MASHALQEEQQAKLRELSAAEGRLSAIKSTPQQHTAAMQQRLSAAEQQVGFRAEVSSGF